MLTEKDYCDYETCVALKELGFREKCPTYYDTEDNVGLLLNTQWTSDYMPCQFIDCLESHNSNTSDDNSYVDAPTMWEAQKWLREENGIEIVVLSKGMVGSPYYSQVYTEDYAVGGDEEYSTYEEALLGGIKEAVKIFEGVKTLNKK